MANFGDELRSAPAQAELERKAREEAERDQWYAEYLKKDREVVDGTIWYFQEQCRKAAKEGKRSIDCKPSISSSFDLGNNVVSWRVTKKSNEERTQKLVPEVEKRLATMGLRSYRVFVVTEKASLNPAIPAYHYVGFRIQASW